MTLPTPNWDASLAQMQTALDSALAALDRYQESWQVILAEGSPGPGHRGALLEGLEGRLREWDARLAAAEELAESVGRDLAEREAAVGRWRGAFTGWAELLQQRAESPS